MKKTTCLLFLFTFNFGVYAQKSFEGTIKFKSEIMTTNLSKPDFKEKLERKYGDSLIVFYSQNGNLKRKYLNSGDLGNDFQIFNAKKGMLYLKNKNSVKIDSGNVKINSIIKLIHKKKISNEYIMNLDCECYEYVGLSKFNQNITLTYCFSKLTPKIDFKLFENHNDFFLNEFFQSSERPYLKFSIETEKFKITYFATKMEEKNIDNKIFEIN